MQGLHSIKKQYYCRIILINLCSIFILNSAAAQPAVSEKLEEKPTIVIYTARKIITMDPANPEATAIAVKDGKILAIGSLVEMQKWMKPGSYKINNEFHDDVITPYKLQTGKSANFIVYGIDPILEFSTNGKIPIIAIVKDGTVYQVRNKSR